MIPRQWDRKRIRYGFRSLSLHLLCGLVPAVECREQQQYRSCGEQEHCQCHGLKDHGLTSSLEVTADTLGSRGHTQPKSARWPPGYGLCRVPASSTPIPAIVEVGRGPDAVTRLRGAAPNPALITGYSLQIPPVNRDFTEPQGIVCCLSCMPHVWLIKLSLCEVREIPKPRPGGSEDRC